MRTLGKILTAGTLLATPLFPTAAISQSQVLNDQIVLDDVFANQELDVIDVSDSTSVITPVTGNTFTGSAVATGVDVQSNQDVQADISASALVNASGYTGDVTALSTAATGNSGEANVFEGGTLTGLSVQTTGDYNVTASGEYNGPTGRTGALSSSSQAVGNSQGYGVSAASAEVYVEQTNGADVQADDGGTLQYTDGTAIFSALATGNNVTGTGEYGSAVTVDAYQYNVGERTQASVFTNAGNAQDITGQATVTGNNYSVTNEGYVGAYVTQDNEAAIRSQVELSSYDFGAATSSAYGVGNSVMAGAIGPALVMENTQLNTGAGVEVSATFTGNDGYDAYVSSTAIGNAVTGYACSYCGGDIYVTNSQTSSTPVGAYGGVNITGSNRSVQTLSAATGNSATFYATSPD